MIYPLNPVLMELLVLAMICREDSYGYQISQQMKRVSNLKDSTLYPVLRRLAENRYVVIYDQQFQGRNRKYYRITEAGKQQKDFLEQEWNAHVQAVREILENNRPAEDQEKAENNRPAEVQEKAENIRPAEVQEKVENNGPAEGQEKVENIRPAEGQEKAENSRPEEGGKR